jgi:ferrous iron transport protein B
MSSFVETPPLTVALIGNPNTGKSTLFSGLVGVHQHVGNYPGVTVEKKSGSMEYAGRRFEMIDLPGLYSLAPRSRDEMVAVDLLIGRQPDEPEIDIVLCIVDAGNLERNLYLLSQVLECGLPTVVAVNMIDVAKQHGLELHLKRLEQQLGVPLIPIQANRGVGLPLLKAALVKTVKERAKDPSPISNLPSEISHPSSAFPSRPIFPESFESEVTSLQSQYFASEMTVLPRWIVRRLLLDVNGYLQHAMLSNGQIDWKETLTSARDRLTNADCPIPGIETSVRYDWAKKMLDGVIHDGGRRHATVTDRIDRVLTHRVWGILIFAIVMLTIFQSVFVGARPAMNAIETATTAVGDGVRSLMADGALRSLLVDGVIGGVGGVLAFLPQILILFAFLAVLEDCGYMARSAFLMDRVMARVGLSGKSFIPLLSSFACAVPGIMATRVIENERDRLTTILVAPLLTCSARLPIYALLIAAFIPSRSYLGGLLNLQGLTLASLYLLGIFAAVVCAIVFKRTLLRGQRPPFVMELPSYKWPSPRTVLFRMTERGWMFIRCAGTLILAVSILVWTALYFPRDPSVTHLEQQRNSYLGQAGRVIEPVVRPLGWDWRIGCAVIASFPAREIVVATLGVMYHIDDPPDHSSTDARDTWNDTLRRITWDGTDRPVFNIPVALSIMVFFALCAQCTATLAVIRRETNSWRWPAFTFTYMTVLAYLGALATYQLGMWIGG